MEAENAKIRAEKDAIERAKAIKEAEEKARLQAIADEKQRVEMERVAAEEKAAQEKAEAERVAALMPDKEKAIAWVEACRESIPKRPTIKDKGINRHIVVTIDAIKMQLDDCYREIEEA